MSDDFKPIGYYENTRPDLIEQLPRPLGAVLDVGCGSGTTGQAMRAEGASRLVGIEPMPDAAAAARGVYDELVEATVEDGLAQLSEERFDTICCYDVLEHLVDPYAVLRELHGVAAPGGRLHVSVPNARHYSLLYDLVVRGTFGYTEWGHRDNTHMRWFTRSDIADAVREAGWTVASVGHSPLVRTARLNRWTRGAASQFLAYQSYVLATR